MVSTEDRKRKRNAWPHTKREQGDVCGNINDPIRTGLCKVCNMPVVGEAPFCKDHSRPSRERSKSQRAQ